MDYENFKEQFVADVKDRLDKKQDEKARQLSCRNRKKFRIEALKRARKLGWTVIKGRAEENFCEKGGDKS